MSEAATEERLERRFFCHLCKVEVTFVTQNYTCPVCAGGFVEEMSQTPQTDQPVDDRPVEDMEVTDDHNYYQLSNRISDEISSLLMSISDPSVSITRIPTPPPGTPVYGRPPTTTITGNAVISTGNEPTALVLATTNGEIPPPQPYLLPNAMTIVQPRMTRDESAQRAPANGDGLITGRDVASFLNDRQLTLQERLLAQSAVREERREQRQQEVQRLEQEIRQHENQAEASLLDLQRNRRDIGDIVIDLDVSDDFIDVDVGDSDEGANADAGTGGAIAGTSASASSSSSSSAGASGSSARADGQPRSETVIHSVNSMAIPANLRFRRRINMQNFNNFDNMLQEFLISVTSGGASGGTGSAGGSISATSAPMFFMGNPADYAWGREGLDTIVTQLLNQMDGTGPPPLPKDKIAEIPFVEISKEHVDAKLQCSVCWDDYLMHEVVRKLPCSHLYHESCIVPWLDLHGTCPVCRKSLSTENPEEQHRNTAVGITNTLRNVAAYYRYGDTNHPNGNITIRTGPHSSTVSESPRPGGSVQLPASPPSPPYAYITASTSSDPNFLFNDEGNSDYEEYD